MRCASWYASTGSSEVQPLKARSSAIRQTLALSLSQLESTARPLRMLAERGGRERRKRHRVAERGACPDPRQDARRKLQLGVPRVVVERVEERVELLRLFFGSLDCSELPLNLLHRVTRQALGPLGWVERFLRAQLRIEAGEPAL